MQDICFHADSEPSIISVLTSLGLTAPDMDGKPRPIGVYAYDEQLVDKAGEYAPGPDGVMATIKEPVCHPGVYARYRATDEQAAKILAATMPDGVEIVEPPVGLPLFDGEWLMGESPAQKLAAAIATKRIAAAAAADAALAPYAARFGVLERETWQAQLAEAIALRDTPSLAEVPADTTDWIDPIPAIRTITAITGEDVLAFAADVRQNNATWLRLATTAAGQRQRAVAEIQALPDVAAVEAYEIVIAL